MIICGECGETYRRHQQYNENKKYYIWACKKHENMGSVYCKAKPISEKATEEAFLRALNGLIKNRNEILDKLKSEIVGGITDSCAAQIEKLDRKIQTAQDNVLNLIQQKTKGQIGLDEYDKCSRKLMLEIDALNLQKEEALSEQGRMHLAEYRADAIEKLFETGKKYSMSSIR